MDYETFKVTDVSGEEKISASADAVVEEPLKIVVNNSDVASIMRTPGNEKELAIGFLFSEGLINSIDDIQMFDAKGSGTVGSANVVNVKLRDGISLNVKPRAYEVRSSCGICGQEKIDDLFNDIDKIKSSFKVKSSDIFRMPELMAEKQTLSKKTRGAHAAALFTRDAGLIHCYEDVGRHNALDKLIGACLISGTEMGDKVLLLSGRTSYEMMAKALRCRIPFVASISAPSTLAVEIAKRGGIALCAIVRGSTMKIYNGADDFIN
jgi:FdhD protein